MVALTLGSKCVTQGDFRIVIDWAALKGYGVFLAVISLIAAPMALSEWRDRRQATKRYERGRREPSEAPKAEVGMARGWSRVEAYGRRYPVGLSLASGFFFLLVVYLLARV
jgi:hypothetical protein